MPRGGLNGRKREEAHSLPFRLTPDFSAMTKVSSSCLLVRSRFASAASRGVDSGAAGWGVDPLRTCSVVSPGLHSSTVCSRHSQQAARSARCPGRKSGFNMPIARHRIPRPARDCSRFISARIPPSSWRGLRLASCHMRRPPMDTAQRRLRSRISAAGPRPCAPEAQIVQQGGRVSLDRTFACGRTRRRRSSWFDIGVG